MIETANTVDVEAKTMTLHPYVNLGIAVDLAAFDAAEIDIAGTGDADVGRLRQPGAGADIARAGDCETAVLDAQGSDVDIA